jgi:hypothetical protein
VKFCPHCGGDLSAYLAAEGPNGASIQTPVVSATPRKYDQTKVWRDLVQRAREIGGEPPDISHLALAAADKIRPFFKTAPLSTVVHIVFDKNVVPQGGILYQAAQIDGRMKNAGDQLEALGYSMEDGKVKLVDDMPVGPVYGAIDYWGGEKQHRRWHLAAPVTVNPSRNGDLFFMDDNMVAFGAKWKDAERLDQALLELLGVFENGIKGSGPIAQPLVMELVAQPS